MSISKYKDELALAWHHATYNSQLQDSIYREYMLTAKEIYGAA